MNDYQVNLFNQLQALVASNQGTFYHQEFSFEGHFYQIFNYRLASYSEFLLPSAMEARGSMFEVDTNGHLLRLASLPFNKFFNLNENPMTMNLDLKHIAYFETKADGSLMSTYMHKNTLRLKSKGSLFSEQALDAMAFLQLPENQDLLDTLTSYTENQFTVNLEWCAPQNRIVIGYIKPRLVILNSRQNWDGKYYDIDDVDRKILPKETFIEKHKVADPVAFVNSISSMEGVEGFVATFNSGLKVKIKTAWYLALHHTKDSINSDRRLYETVLAEGSDDLRSMFPEDQVVLDRIDKMEKFVSELYNKLVLSVETFCVANLHLCRKDFAILGQKQLDKHAFRIAIEKYIGRPVDYKKYLSDHWKDFNITDNHILEDSI